MNPVDRIALALAEGVLRVALKDAGFPQEASDLVVKQIEAVAEAIESGKPIGEVATSAELDAVDAAADAAERAKFK